MLLNKQREVRSVQELDIVAQWLLNHTSGANVYAFWGEMGAGKTTFIQSICKLIGVKDRVTSPSFSIVNEYLSASGESVYHFDFYRIKSEEEVYDLGYEEYFYSGNYCFIEWPTKILNLLPENFVRVQIDVMTHHRVITI